MLESEILTLLLQKKLKANLDKSIENLCAPVSRHDKVRVKIPKAEELKQFYDSLSECKNKPVCLRTNLFDENYLQISNYANLLQECQNIQLRISDAEIQLIERETLNQARERSFYQHREGRIGASQSEAASHTDPCQPSQSLIKAICYPNVFKFSTAATRHGCKHEPLAIKEYEKQIKSEHENFQVKNCGTFINNEYLFLQATPNFHCSCDCCGLGCGEVKCPFCIDSLDFETYVVKEIIMPGKN